jgi:hypothetical protein
MGGARAGLLAVALVQGSACNFGIETAGLVSDGESVADAAGSDVGVRTDGGTTSHEAGITDGNGSADRSPGPDAPPPTDVVVPDASGDTSVVCSVDAIQAVPGTSEYQVMANSDAQAQVITLTAGHLLVAVAYGGQGPGNSTPLTVVPNMTFAVSDTLGNAFYAGPMVENSNSNQAAIQIFYAPNVTGGADTVTASSSSSGTSISLWTGLFLQEYSGIAATDVVDVGSAQMAPSSTSTITPGTVTTSTQCDLVVGAFTDGHVGGQNLTAGSGWVFRSTDDWDPGASVDNAPFGASRGTPVDATMMLTGGSDDGWVATQLAFRGTGTTAPVQPNDVTFSTAPRTVMKGACSEIVTVQSVHGTGVARTSNGIHLALTGPVGVGFFADPGCVYPIPSLYIGAGTSSSSFYFSSANSGSVKLQASNASTLSANQTETVD